LTGVDRDSYPATTALIGQGCLGPIPAGRNLNELSPKIQRVETTTN